MEGNGRECAGNVREFDCLFVREEWGNWGLFVPFQRICNLPLLTHQIPSFPLNQRFKPSIIRYLGILTGETCVKDKINFLETTSGDIRRLKRNHLISIV